MSDARFDHTTGRYVHVPLAFSYPGGKLECRLAWSGVVGLRIDSISLFRVEGARHPPAGENQDAVAVFQDLVQVGGRKDDGTAALPTFQELVPHPHSRFNVQTACRMLEQKDVQIGMQERQQRALLVAA